MFRQCESEEFAGHPEHARHVETEDGDTTELFHSQPQVVKSRPSAQVQLFGIFSEAIQS